MQTIVDNPDEGDWMLEKDEIQFDVTDNPWRRNGRSILSYPFHVLQMDDLESLSVILNFNMEHFVGTFDCLKPWTSSFKVFLHRPDEVKEAFLHPIEVEIGKKVTLYIKPRLVIASEQSRKYGPASRNCYFNSEYQLKYFKIYTSSNCHEECLRNSIEKECGCVKFSMPRDSKANVCDAEELPCYSAAIKKHRLHHIKGVPEGENEECVCSRACMSVSYEAEIVELDYIDGHYGPNG